MKKAKILISNQLAGVLTEDESGYSFYYQKEYLHTRNAEAISLTLPLQEDVYHSNILFPFFDGLIPEGWLLNIVENSWKIDRRDRMSLLLACCKDCIGAISVIPIENEML
jgi:serine/threonine-protein kinase HipA